MSELPKNFEKPQKAVVQPPLVLGSDLCWDCEHNRLSTCPYEPNRPATSCGAWFTNAAVEYGDSPRKKVAMRELLAREVRTEGSSKTPEERAELEDGFRQRISSENVQGMAAGADGPPMLRD
jgi:hypothetical protein